MQVAVEQAGQEAVYFREAEGLVRLHRLPRESSCTRGDSPIAGFRQSLRDLWHNANPDKPALILFTKPRGTARFFCCPARSTRK